MYLLIDRKSPKDLDYDPSTGELLWQKYFAVSDHFQAVLTKMLEISVKQRYRTAMEVVRALDLEDHLEMLENSMTSVKPGANTGRKNPDCRGADSAGAKVSPCSRQAMGIRARQQSRPDSTNLHSGFTRGRLADSDRLGRASDDSGIG